MKDIERLLKDKGITPTPVRLLVYRCLAGSETPQSLADIETALESVDKSTISRSLSLFREHHLLHSFNDGSGSVKYEICHSQDSDDDEDSHVHFRCERCGKTYCLNTVMTPKVELPEGFSVHEINYIITGICSNCK